MTPRRRKRIELLLGKAAVVGFLSMIGHPNPFGYEVEDYSKPAGLPMAKIPGNWRLPVYWRQQDGTVILDLD